jgi:HD-GYP domain-containing protein (c-di-GMP phosphodiesterase class II)
VGGPPEDWVGVIVLSALGIASWMLRETDVGARVQFSFTSIIMLAAAVIVGPVGAGIVGMVSTLVQLGHEKFIVRLFNVAMFTCMATVGALVYLAVGGVAYAKHVTGAGSLLLDVGLPMIVAEVAQCVTNAVLLALILRVATGVPMRMQAWKLLSTTGLAYVGYGVIGFLFVVLWIPAGVGLFSAVLVLAPLFVARWAFVQYGEELRAHERTLRALVTAEETKEPHNAGHSERVAQLCEWLGEMLGLGHKEIQDVRTAGMLHDIGKVGVPSRLLRARTTLTDEEHAVVAGHAVMGVELVRGIDFLAGSVDGIAHHHERFDGRGYPAGLAGEAIPLSARIVGVADVFDCLTTSRPYRPALTVSEALDVLQSRAGTQFDPHVVETLGRVLVRHPWEPLERSEQMLATSGVAWDHDEPEVSDLLAARADLRRRLREAPRGVAEPVGGRS